MIVLAAVLVGGAYTVVVRWNGISSAEAARGATVARGSARSGSGSSGCSTTWSGATATKGFRGHLRALRHGDRDDRPGEAGPRRCRRSPRGTDVGGGRFVEMLRGGLLIALGGEPGQPVRPGARAGDQGRPRSARPSIAVARCARVAAHRTDAGARRRRRDARARPARDGACSATPARTCSARRSGSGWRCRSAATGEWIAVGVLRRAQPRQRVGQLQPSDRRDRAAALARPARVDAGAALCGAALTRTGSCVTRPDQRHPRPHRWARSR